MNKLKDNRNWFLVMILSFITLGLYGIYLMYVQIRDTNIACHGDGRKTAGIIKFLLLSIITFGIYALVWDIKLVSRWQNYSEMNGEKSKYPLILHVILAYVLSATGICAIISSYLKLSAYNQVCRIYNGNSDGGNSFAPKKDKGPNPADNLWGWKDSTSSKM